MRPRVTGPELLTPGEVCALWRINPKTLWKWDAAGKLTSIRTPGGTRRYSRAEVMALLNGSETPTPGTRRRTVIYVLMLGIACAYMLGLIWLATR